VRSESGEGIDFNDLHPLEVPALWANAVGPGEGMAVRAFRKRRLCKFDVAATLVAPAF
jgi:hypothetical protein